MTLVTHCKRSWSNSLKLRELLCIWIPSILTGLNTRPWFDDKDDDDNFGLNTRPRFDEDDNCTDQSSAFDNDDVDKCLNTRLQFDDDDNCTDQSSAFDDDDDGN
ncbi:hypothetical protein CFP56_043527 [Quercus suber]|uniref:Uncharacterized protein n=1 Tax=Quercus suber TaxID=58331 RepID=A0AAW0LH89_QUESU